ncbi:MAG: DUF433 domain-containing protein [Cyclobacteriaceae bacterium]
MLISDIINTNPQILGGEPVFQGTRVPIKNLFDYLGTGESLDEFLDDFPSVSREQAVNLLMVANRLINASTEIIDENIT